MKLPLGVPVLGQIMIQHGGRRFRHGTTLNIRHDYTADHMPGLPGRAGSGASFPGCLL